MDVNFSYHHRRHIESLRKPSLPFKVKVVRLRPFGASGAFCGILPQVDNHSDSSRHWSVPEKKNKAKAADPRERGLGEGSSNQAASALRDGTSALFQDRSEIRVQPQQLQRARFRCSLSFFPHSSFINYAFLSFQHLFAPRPCCIGERLGGSIPGRLSSESPFSRDEAHWTAVRSSKLFPQA